MVEPVKEPEATRPGEDSDVFVCQREPERVSEVRGPTPAELESVTLFVFGWHVVEPGTLSWVFPSLRSAVDAVRTMRNAAQWCIVRGADWSSLDHARNDGAVLIEQLA